MIRHGNKSLSQAAAPPRSRSHRGPFGRLFRTLPPYIPPGGESEANLRKVMSKLAQQMLETAEEGPDTKLDNKSIPSGYTYFGQFIDHDITFDPASSLQRQNDPNMLEDFRTPRFDLDNLYGEGPADEPFMYDMTVNVELDPERSGYFLIGKGRDVDVDLPLNQQILGDKLTSEDDLPRNVQFRALIGDPRNDENVIVAQLQLAFLKFHNRTFDHVKATRPDLSSELQFEEAQRLVRWHYQWVVIEDFLKRLIGKKRLRDMLPARSEATEGPTEFNLKVYNYSEYPFMPVEFSGAAYRMGHSMVRSTYVLNDVLDEIVRGEPFPIFMPTEDKKFNFLADLRGVRPLPRFWSLQWNRFLEFDGEAAPQFSRLIDAKLAAALGEIPAGPGRKNPLAFLNLVRGVRLSLPSGQRVAKALGIPKVFTNAELGLDAADFGEEAPLWYYVLKESELVEESKGAQLGPVGATLIGEVFLGLAKGDPLCYLNVEPNWRPEPPFVKAKGDPFELRDIIQFAGMPITRADIEKMTGPAPKPPEPEKPVEPARPPGWKQ